MYLGTNFLPPVIHPTQEIVNHTFSTTVVPHIHPVHTTTVNHHMFQHKHYCPHTASCAEECCNQHIDCCNTCGPAPIAAPLANAVPNAPGFGGYGGPGFGPGAPGFGPGPGAPGFGPGAPGFGPGAPGFGPGPGFGAGPGSFRGRRP